MVELGFPELTTEQIVLLCKTAENSSRKYILSKVASKEIEHMDISVEVEGSKPVNVTVEIDLQLSKQKKDIDTKVLVDQAVKKAHETTEDFLRNIK